MSEDMTEQAGVAYIADMETPYDFDGSESQVNILI